MSVRISSIADRGVIDSERVILKVETDDDIGHYALFRGKLNEKGLPLSGKVDDAYWFMNRPVKGGDFVVLYTKSGNRSEKKNESGTTSYFFYWGLTGTAWSAGEAPILVETPNWSYEKPR